MEAERRDLVVESMSGPLLPDFPSSEVAYLRPAQFTLTTLMPNVPQ